jgi:phosphatidylserine/phosphatidylglycerophosphate/cardiolipin synthase-like enzyme
MKANNPRIERLREMLALEERRARLHIDLAGVIAQMSALKDQLFEGVNVRVGAITRQVSGTTRAGSGRKARRGALKEKIMAALEAAGTAGVRVKDLAAELATKPVNIHSWFHSTSKRNPAIRKLSGGHYRLDSKGSASPQSSSPQRTTSAGGRKGRKQRGGQSKRGELSSRIIKELQASGARGITVRNLADKLGAKYKNIYIWFATTGKKNKNIKKMGPATYKLVG